MPSITELAAASSIAAGDQLVVNQSGTDRRVDAAKFLLLDNSGRAPTMHIYRTLGGGVWPLKIEGVSTGQPAIEFVDGAGTPNRWLLAVGKNTVSDGIFTLYDIRQAQHRLSVNTSGVVMINNLAGSGNRAIYSDPNGNLTNTASDERLKTDIEAITPDEALGIVEALAPVRYNWRDPERGEQREMGFIAQQVEAVAPEVIGANSDGMLSLDYAKLVAVLAGAVQALSARVAELERRA